LFPFPPAVPLKRFVSFNVGRFRPLVSTLLDWFLILGKPWCPASPKPFFLSEFPFATSFFTLCGTCSQSPPHAPAIPLHATRTPDALSPFEPCPHGCLDTTQKGSFGRSQRGRSGAAFPSNLFFFFFDWGTCSSGSFWSPSRPHVNPPSSGFSFLYSCPPGCWLGLCEFLG